MIVVGIVEVGNCDVVVLFVEFCIIYINYCIVIDSYSMMVVRVIGCICKECDVG